MPRVSSADADTLAARFFVEVLQNPTPNSPFAIINDTHHAALRTLAELFNIITKSTEHQSTNRHNGRRWKRQDVEDESEKVISPVTH